MRPLATLLPAALLLTVGCASSSGSGTLIDVLDGNKPIADARLIAEADGSASLQCTTFEATTDAAGKFSFDKLCSGTSYTIKPGNENLWLAEDHTIPDGGIDGLDLKVWRAPKGSGVYLLADGELKAIKTSADIKKEPIWNSESEVALYPATVPKNPARVPADGFLVLVGDRAVEKMQYFPLIKSDVRKFGSPSTTVITMDPWSYIGLSFTSDTEFARKTATPDAAKIVKKSSDDRTSAWIPGSALPPGRYAMHKEGDGRTTVVDFGTAAAEPAAPAEAPADAPK